MSQSLKLHLQATADLLRHYGRVIRHLWAIRKQLDPVPRLAHEAEFLPAALSLQETPPSPAPRIAMWLIMSFFGLALLWSIFGKVDITATAQGKIIPGDRVKLIQPIETASVRAIHVTEGQFVKAGDVLVELDATVAQADAEKTQEDLVSARLQAIRASALLTAIRNKTSPKAEWPDDVSKSRIAQDEQVLQGQYDDFVAKERRIEADIARREAELQTAKALVAKLEQTAPLASRRAEDLGKLVEQGFVSKHGFYDREQVRMEQAGDLAAQRARLGELTAGIAQGRADLAALIAETKRVASESYNESSQRAASYAQEHTKALSRNRLMTLTAPVDGTVQQLALHTIGGVVTPAQPLMSIVPQESDLEVEAFIENKDVGFVSEGQEAQAKLETFLYTKYGTIPATVTHVSHDAIQDEKRGLIYSARVRLSKSSLDVDGRNINLSPGMNTTVEIKTGQRRVIEFLLSPLQRHVSEAGRER